MSLGDFNAAGDSCVAGTDSSSPRVTSPLCAEKRTVSVGRGGGTGGKLPLCRDEPATTLDAAELRKGMFCSSISSSAATLLAATENKG
jgi:hypothetical protein